MVFIAPLGPSSDVFRPKYGVGVLWVDITRGYRYRYSQRLLSRRRWTLTNRMYEDNIPWLHKKIANIMGMP